MQFKIKKCCPSLYKKSLMLLCFLLGLLVLKQVITGEKSYYFQFTYPMENLQDIVNEIVKTGNSSVKPLNNVAKQNNVRLVPSNGFSSKNLCDSFDMVFIVKSFAGNFAQRIAIRNTWGKSEIIRLTTVFVLGYIKDMQNYIDLESKKYQDILQFDMTDNYENLVYKTIYSMTWLADHNINTQYVHFLDDDRMVNTFNLYNFALTSITQTDMKMIGYQVSFGMPFRDSSSKWYISVDDYPFDLWPPYLIGGTILTNMEVVKNISLAFPFTKIIRMEDTFIGIIAKLLSIKVVHNSGFLPHYISGLKLKDKLSSPDYRSYNMIMEGWKQIMN